MQLKKIFLSFNRSLFWQISALLLAVTACAFIALFAVLQISQASTGKGSAINISGSLRMQSYVLALTVANSAAEPEYLRKQHVTEAVDEFERRLTSPGLTSALPNSSYSLLRKTYDHISSDFYSEIRPAALATIEKPELSFRFLQKIPSFVSVIDSFVFDLEKDLEEQTDFIRKGLIGFMALAFLLFFFVRFYLRRVLFDPLADLARLASSVRSGDFSQSSSYKKKNEIGTLAGSMNYMIQDLSRLYSSLEEQVREKTADLNRQNNALNLLYRLKNLFGTELNSHTLENALSFCAENLEAKAAAVLLKNTKENSVRSIASFNVSEDLKKEIHSLMTGLSDSSHNSSSVISLPLLESSNTIYCAQALIETTDLFFVAVYSPKHSAPIDNELLKSIAGEFAQVISNSEKRVESRRLILFEERSTIARELHDSIAQSLSFSKIQITRLDVALKQGADEKELRSIMEELKLGIMTAYQQLRSVLTTFRLKPKSPDLRENILSIVDEFRDRSAIACSVDIQIQSFELDANRQIHLLQVLREALTNVEKHSRASEVEVSLKPTSKDRFELKISDNGQGFDLKQKEGHYGLEIMNERAKVLGGDISIRPVVPHGISVILTFSADRNAK